MSKLLFYLNFAVFALALSSCTVTKDTPKYHFSDGYYKSNKIFGSSSKAVYVDYEEDSIYVYPLQKTGELSAIDTAQTKRLILPEEKWGKSQKPYSFRQSSFDFDLLTILFKYRSQTNGFPRQFNTDFSGGAYVGYRNDLYQLKYQQNPLHHLERRINHYGYSVGAFAGMGSTAITPWVTRQQVNAEYDGLTFTKGVAGIVGINNFTFGLGVGIDHLLDQNRNFWIYQGKVWWGLTLGLNLN